MWQLIGLGGVFATIGIGYTIAGGKFGVIFAVAGPEMLIILGSGVMTLFVANEFGTMKKLAGGLKKIVSGSRWQKRDYIDALCMMFLLIRVARQEGSMALERHIEKPSESPIFSKYPRLLADKTLFTFIADVFRVVTLNFTDAHKVSEMMEAEMEKREHESLKAPKALATMADALPALGIVAAVLGVIKAMGAISESPDVLGHMIGSALVGTFLGVLLSYGLIGPMAARMRGVVEEEGLILGVVHKVVTSHLEGLGPQLAVEVGRMSVPSKYQPSFDELDKLLSETARATRKSE